MRLLQQAWQPALALELLRHRFTVRVRGDFIRDEHGTSVDGNHLAPWLPNVPSGDMVPGGQFESWFTVSG